MHASRLRNAPHVLRTMVNWPNFISEAIAAVQEPLALVLQASGCREGWPQGELFRAGQQHSLRVNEHHLGKNCKADLSAPGMVAEIKIVGADYESKMCRYIEDDVARMRGAGAELERYMILIVPRSEEKTRLGAYLDTCQFSPTCLEREFPRFRLKIWRL